MRLAILIAFSFASLISSNTLSPSQPVLFQDGIEVEAGGMHNVHVAYDLPLNGALSIHYGSCDATTPQDCHHGLGEIYVGKQPSLNGHEELPSETPSKFVWLPPSDIQSSGCLHSFLNGELVGRSAPVTVKKREERRTVVAANIMDAEGPWFDGVAYLKSKEPNTTFVAKAKSQKIGIVGGGMAGLMTAHLLDSVGLYDWTIVEASSRIGGRVHTTYLNNTRPDQYQYQEMGPMRFPVSTTDLETGKKLPILDHRMVFQLAKVLNKQNDFDSRYAVNFIKWINTADVAPYIPTIPETNHSVVNTADSKVFGQITRIPLSEVANNIFKAHKKAIEDGLFDFSEAGYIRYALNYSKNIADEAYPSWDDSPIWNQVYGFLYFTATDWLTIDQGLDRLPKAFSPQVLNRTIFDTAVQGLRCDQQKNKVFVEYRSKEDLFEVQPGTMEFDYAVVAAPFSRVRLWNLPAFGGLLTRAITSLNYDFSCKVAILYKTRFWEHLPLPIYGGCRFVSNPGIEQICYPSYKINSSLPGALLASYTSSEMTSRAVSALSDAEHVAMVQRAMVDVHGSVAQEQYTGIYDRICWQNDEFTAGAWGNGAVGQQDVYMPAYFRTEFNTVFVGEHTSYTQAWIWSALESAVRGTVQLLLDNGLVDEAKQITDFWMARWIKM